MIKSAYVSFYKNPKFKLNKEKTWGPPQISFIDYVLLKSRLTVKNFKEFSCFSANFEES